VLLNVSGRIKRQSVVLPHHQLRRQHQANIERVAQDCETEFGQIELALANAIHQFDARDRCRGISEPFEAEYHVRSGLDVSLVLLNHIVQTRRASDLRVFGQQAIGLHLPQRAVRGSVTIERVVSGG